MPAVDVVAKLRAYWQAAALPVPPGSVTVGFSGGADSTALLLLLCELGWQAQAVHLHHGLRPEADADQEWAAAFCRERGLPFAAARLDVPAARRRGESLEMAARRLRLAWWREHLEPGARLALGHHADDALETLLLRLLRGANASGLAALRPLRRWGGLTILRPLLGLDRAEIESFLASQGVHDWRRDASNACPAMRRNRVRHEVLPLLAELAGGREGLRHSLAFLEADALALEALAAQAVPGLGAELSRPLLLAQPPAVRQRLLAAWLRQHGGLEPAPRGRLLAALARALPAPRGRVAAGPGLQVRWDGPALRLVAGAAARPGEAAGGAAPRSWSWRREPELCLPEWGGRLVARLLPVAAADWRGADAGRACFDPAALGDTLLLRRRQPGDRLQPFGGSGPVRLKKLLAGTARAGAVPLVVTTLAGEIAWVPGVRRAALAPVTSATETLVELAFLPL